MSLQLGHIVIDRGGLKGRVVANIDQGEFSPDCLESEWAYLSRGVVINTAEAGLVHYENADEVALLPSL